MSERELNISNDWFLRFVGDREGVHRVVRVAQFSEGCVQQSLARYFFPFPRSPRACRSARGGVDVLELNGTQRGPFEHQHVSLAELREPRQKVVVACEDATTGHVLFAQLLFLTRWLFLHVTKQLTNRGYLPGFSRLVV